MELRRVAFDIQRELVKRKEEEKRKLKIRLRKMECRWNSAQLDSNSETLARWNLITGSKYSASNNNLNRCNRSLIFLTTSLKIRKRKREKKGNVTCREKRRENGGRRLVALFDTFSNKSGKSYSLVTLESLKYYVPHIYMPDERLTTRDREDTMCSNS